MNENSVVGARPSIVRHLGTERGEHMTQEPTDYTVLIEAEGGPDDLPVDDRGLEDLGHAIYYHGDAMTGAGGHRYGVDVHVESVDAADAVSRALDLFRAAVRRAGLPPWKPVHVRAMTALERQIMTWRAMEAGRVSDPGSGPEGGSEPDAGSICPTCLDLYAGSHNEHCWICFPEKATRSSTPFVALEEGHR